MPDRRGSGKNQSDRCDAATARQLLDDVHAALEHAHKLAGTLAGQEMPLDLLGVSWGGKLAMAYLENAECEMRNAEWSGPASEHLAFPLRSLTLVAPGLCPRVSVPWSVKLAVAYCMLAGQKLRLFDLPLCDPTLFTDNSERQVYIRDDPLALRQGTARLLFVSYQLDKLARRYRESWADHARPVPMHLVLAGQDRIIHNARTLEWFAPLAGHLTVSEFPKAGHTLEFEPQPGDYFQCVSNWLEKQDAAQ
jgi:acylglycerol lipase